jgi:hypothetical protein
VNLTFRGSSRTSGEAPYASTDGSSSDEETYFERRSQARWPLGRSVTPWWCAASRYRDRGCSDAHAPNRDVAIKVLPWRSRGERVARKARENDVVVPVTRGSMTTVTKPLLLSA